MKLFLSIISGLLFGLIAFGLFSTHINTATGFAGLQNQQAASLILSKERARYANETKSYQESQQKNQQSTPPKPLRWQYADDPQLIKTAEVAIARSNEIKQMSEVSIAFRKCVFVIFGCFFGTISYLMWCFIVTITTKPLDSVLDSIWGNFKRFALIPFIGTVIAGGLFWIFCGSVIMEAILPSPNI